MLVFLPLPAHLDEQKVGSRGTLCVLHSIVFAQLLHLTCLSGPQSNHRDGCSLIIFGTSKSMINHQWSNFYHKEEKKKFQSMQSGDDARPESEDWRSSPTYYYFPYWQQWQCVINNCLYLQKPISCRFYWCWKTTESALLFCVRTSWVRCSARWERSSAPLAAGWKGRCRKLKMPVNIVWWGFWMAFLALLMMKEQQIGSCCLFNKGAC